MNSKKKLITNNILTDNLFINFPIWFPLIYLFLIFNFIKNIIFNRVNEKIFNNLLENYITLLFCDINFFQ